jgi:hypothetical protein
MMVEWNLLSNKNSAPSFIVQISGRKTKSQTKSLSEMPPLPLHKTRYYFVEKVEKKRGISRPTSKQSPNF